MHVQWCIPPLEVEKTTYYMQFAAHRPFARRSWTAGEEAPEARFRGRHRQTILRGKGADEVPPLQERPQYKTRGLPSTSITTLPSISISTSPGSRGFLPAFDLLHLVPGGRSGGRLNPSYSRELARWPWRTPRCVHVLLYLWFGRYN